MCSISFSDKISLAGVRFMHDHYELLINLDAFNQLPELHRLGVLKHEMLHILYNHTGRRNDRDPQLFNIAADCAINQHINADHLPAGCVTPQSINCSTLNETAEFYYNFLLANPDEAEKFRTPELTDLLESEGDPDICKNIARHMAEKAMKATEKARGSLPSNISAILKLLSRPREISWEQYLRNLVGNKKVSSKRTILRPDRRQPHFEHIKGKTKNRTFNVLIVGDVSGSMSDAEVIATWQEVRHICKLTKTDLHLVQIDTQAYPPEKLSPNTTTISRKASGGTYLYPAVEMANDHHLDYQAIIITTDGGVCKEDINSFNALKLPIIWLVSSSGTTSPYMTTSHMRAFQLSA
jgi:predicted metal-dependent peptidase